MRLMILSVFLVLVGATAYGQEVPIRQEGEKAKRAQTGMKFTSVSIAPRAAALGDAVTSVELGASSMFYNPSSLARTDGMGSLYLGQMQWVGDISHNAGALAINPVNGRYGVVGVSVRAVDYGEFERTRRANNEAGYLEMGTYSPSGIELGITYARSVTDRFSVGGSAKYVRQNLGTGSLSMGNGAVQSESFDASTPAFDFGIIYSPGIESLNFAMSVRNFSPALTVIDESFELPLTFNVGLSMDVMDMTTAAQNHSLLLSVDTAHPRDYDQTVRIGGEYSFMDILFVRSGVSVPSDEQGLSFGGGLHYEFSGINMRADYTYTNMGIFDSVSRIGLGIGF